MIWMNENYTDLNENQLIYGIDIFTQYTAFIVKNKKVVFFEKDVCVCSE